MLPEAAGRRAVRMGVATQHTPWGGVECCGLWEGKGLAGLALGLDTGQQGRGTHSTRWGWTPSARRRSFRWPRECAPGTPASRACSSSRCPSHLSAAQCPRSSASGSPRSRCCRRGENPLTTDHLRELEVTHSGRLQYTNKLFSQELRPQWGVRHKAIRETPRGKLLL